MWNHLDDKSQFKMRQGYLKQKEGMHTEKACREIYV